MTELEQQADEEYVEAIDEFLEADRVKVVAFKRRAKAQARLCELMFQRDKTAMIHRRGTLIVKENNWEKVGVLKTEIVDHVE